MIKSGSDLQRAIFLHLESNAGLMAYFRSRLADANKSPQFSFDGLESSLRHAGLELVEHKVRFSVFSGLHAPEDASDVQTLLTKHLTTGFSLANYQIIRFEPVQARGQADTQTRLWRVQLLFDVLTCRALVNVAV